MNSCFYQGHVEHIRHSPVEHRFRNSLTMAYLDLHEVEQLFEQSWLLSSKRFAFASFRAQDHCQALRVDGGSASLATLIKDYVARITGTRPEGPIRLLTQLRQCGLYFSPLNLFYCYQDSGPQEPELQAIVAEVSNTPWNERRLYVLNEENRLRSESELSRPSNLRYAHVKDFHVSPFRELGESYHWTISPPGEDLQVTIRSEGQNAKPFTAGMTLRRVPWSEGRLAWQILRRPVSSMNILGAIHWQALRLWLKRCPFVPHPHKQPGTNQAAPDALTISTRAQRIDPEPLGID